MPIGIPTRLLIVRHGPTAYSAEKRMAGRTDTPLTADGRDAVRRLRELTNAFEIDVAYTSPLARARESCDILAGGRDVRRVEDRRLVERDFGTWEGRTFAEVIAEQPDGGASIMHGPFVSKFLSGETDDAFFARVRAFFDDLVASERKRSVLVVGHAGFLMSMLAIAVGLSPREHFATFRLDPASLTCLDWYDGVPHLVFVNRVPGAAT
ncbi:histidine phosphatase family protein [bacterium]|nr:histidine phosphatase family protein [bacterium]